jgi:prepilin-type N-terminal cleavage/methylation domain-containing protein
MELLKNKIFNLKHGFTLAEVLITLVIIGVVAALTIPTAINKYREQTLKSQFAKAYSTLSQALNKTVMYDFSGYMRCYYLSPYNDLSVTDCVNFYKAFSKNLNVQKTCKGNSFSNGCIPNYQDYQMGSACSGYSKDRMKTEHSAFVLSDGQIISVLSQGGFWPIMMIDINGHKGPNAYGKDLFVLAIFHDVNKNTYLRDFPSCEATPVAGGRTTKEMMLYALAGKN